MKNLVFTLLLLTTISAELIHLAYALSCNQDSIELAYDFKAENEGEETKDLGEDASEIPSLLFKLNQNSFDILLLSNSSLSLVDDQFNRITTPPPDFL